MTDRIAEAAALLADLRLRRNGRTPPIPDLPEAIRPRDMDEAYALQEALGALLERDLGRRVGYKIGLTSKVMQDYIGFDAPAYGRLYESEIRQGSADLRWSDFRRLGLECEIAVRLRADLAPDGDPAAAVGEAMCSVEIVEERFEDFRAASREAMAADDFFTRGVIQGAAVEPAALGDPGAQEGGFSIDGAAPAQIGAGTAILGHPYAALTWLAEARGGLAAGDLVTLGSVVKTIYPEPGRTVRASFTDLPGVEIRIL